MNLETRVGPTAYAHYLPLLYDKSGSKRSHDKLSNRSMEVKSTLERLLVDGNCIVLPRCHNMEVRLYLMVERHNSLFHLSKND